MTKTELKILRTLWDSDKAMCAAEILEANTDLKEITLRTTLKNMLNSELIRIDGITQRTKTFARTFTANVTPDQIYCKEFLNSNEISPFKFASALLRNQELSATELDILRNIIDERIKR